MTAPQATRGGARSASPNAAGGTPLTLLAMVAVVVLSWGLAYPMLRVGMQHSPPFFFAMARTLIGGLLIVAAAVALRRPPPRGTRTLLIVALCGVLNYAVFYGAMNLGVRSLSAGEVAVLNYTMPLWAALLAWPVLGQRLRGLQGAGLLLGFIGVACVVFEELRPGAGTGWQPYVVVLVGALAWAAGSVLFVRSGGDVALEWAVGLQSLIGSAVLALVWLTGEGGRLPDGSLEFWVTFGYVALIASFGAQVAYFGLLRRRETTVVGSFVFLVPVVAAAASALLLGEPLTGLKLAGGACVLAGIALVNRFTSNSPLERSR